MTIQDDIFRQFEGDHYRERRKKGPRSDKQRLKHDLPLKLIERNNLKFQKVAEVGAYNGFRLAFLSEKYGCHAVAFEPSLKALSDGMKKYPDIDFRRNTAALLDSEDSIFDLVIIDFVFHWIDRTTLLRSVAEIDRILVDNGWLIIGDFWIDRPQRSRYHHLPDLEVWTYKQNYWDIYLATNCYQLIDSISKKPSQKDPVPRYCALLKKSFTAGYPVVENET